MDNELIHISIFHTNDMHCRLDSIARLSTYARKLREDARKEGRKVFFWDAGDAADRRSQICSLSKGSAFPPILNSMGITLQTMGNAISMTYGPQSMVSVAAQSKFPILAANCRDGDGPLVEGLREFEIISLTNKLSMGVIGLTAPWGNAYNVFGLRFPDFCEVTKGLISQLKARGVSIIVALSHLGLEDDRILADKVESIDLIIGGHTHNRLENGEVRNGVLIAQAGDYAKAIGRIDLRFDPNEDKLISCTAKVLDIPKDTPPDPLILRAISAAEKEVAEIMAQPIGNLAAALNHDFFQECDIGNLAADALRARMGAEIAIVSSGLLRHNLKAGTLTLGELDAACFSTANPWLSEVRGRQIMEALERGLDPSICKVKPPSYRSTPIGIPQISGMVVSYDSNARGKPRVRHVMIKEQPIEPDRIYRLAHTDAETMSEHGYLELEKEQTIEEEVPTILREVIADYIRLHSPMPLPKRTRWISDSLS